jgi:N-acetyl-anhydromuramyl-L-alanine amidase AmpD
MARPLNDSPYLYGLHDPGGENIMADAGVFGWVLFTEAIGCEPNDMGGKDFGPWANRGFGILVRLNNGYSPDGTIPPASRYGDFAKRCANYVRNSPGAHIWIIGNEMNYPIERPGVKQEGDRLVNPGEAITPSMYANCYRQCRTAIKAVPGHQNDQVIVGSVAPWNNQTAYDGNPHGDWCKYLTDILTILGPANCDGISIHTYTHGSNPEFIYNEYKMSDERFRNREYHFRTYRDFMQAIPNSMRALPVYLTETDQDEPWLDHNNGWVQRAYGEIDAWNKTAGNQKIRAVILYRWPRHDRWYIEGKNGVIEDFKQSLGHRYNWERYLQAQPVQPQPTPPQPAPQPDQPVTPQPTPTEPVAFPQTGKKAQGAFAAFYRKYGVELTGFPLNDEYKHPESGLKTQDWQRVVMEEFPAGSSQVRLRLAGAEAADLRQKVSALQGQVTALQQQIKQLQQTGGVGPSAPEISDITSLLPRNPTGFFKRPAGAIQNIVINHTAVRAEVGAERVAQAHMQRWPGIVGQFFITHQGQIQQTNPIDEVVAQNQPWIYNGISIYVAGNFDEAVPNEPQMSALTSLCAWLMATHGLPLEAIKGAQELVVTGSPGKQWAAGQNWKAQLQERVRSQPMPVQPGGPAADGETAALRGQVAALQAQLTALQTQLQGLNGQLFTLQERNTALTVELELLRSTGGGGSATRLNKPAMSDISQQLPRTAGSPKPRPSDQITALVINHTAVAPSVGADRLAAAHQKRWGAILYHFFITGDGSIQQTNPVDQTVDVSQPWLAQGISIAVAGDFTAQTPTDAQLDATAQLCAWLLQEHKLPIETVKGVSEFIATQSPGTQWLTGKNWKGLLTARIAEIQKTAPPGPAPADNTALLALQAQVRQLQQTLSQAQASISALTTERDQLRAQLSQAPNVTQLNQQLQTVGQQLQAANSDKTTLAQQVQTLTGEKATLNQQVQALNATRATLTQQVQTLTNDKTALTQQLTTARAQLDPLQQALGQAQADISALIMERDQWQAQAQTGGSNAQVNQQIQALNAQIQKAEADKAALTRQVQTLTTEKSALTQRINGLTQTINDLQRQLQQAQNNPAQPTGPNGPSGPVVAGVPVPDIKDMVDQLPKHAINRYLSRPLDKITHLTIHHSAAPGNVALETIARHHVNNNNWPGIGYHFCVEPDGTIYQVNKLETMSYHAGDVNGYTVGICLEGDFRKGVIPTPLQIQNAAHLAAWLATKLHIPVDNIMGHKEFPKNPTECPGDEWATGKQWKLMLHERVRSVLGGDLTPSVKTLGHYVLFWQRANEWASEDYGAAANYVARFRPTLGFSAEDARNAQYVTIVGGPAGVPEETDQMLRNAGCKVERLAGRDFTDTKRMLDDLAQRGQRFQTFAM